MCIPVFLSSGCYKEDVSVLYSRQNKLEAELKRLQDMVDNINSELSTITTIINAIDVEDVIVSVTDLPDGSGYSIIFSKSGEKIIRHGNTPYIGENGNWYVNNVNSGVKAAGIDGVTPYIGANGNWWIGAADTNVKAQGTSGTTPVIGVARDPDNPMDDDLYWTKQVGDGPVEFMLFNGEKIIASGHDGVTPMLGVKQDTTGEYDWTITIPPQEETWLIVDGHKVKAVGEDGTPGEAFFKSVDYSNDDYIIFTINIEPEINVTVPKYKTISFAMEGDQITFESFGQTKVFPFTVSDNVVTVQAYVPDGWRVVVDMFNKTVSVTSPDIRNEFADMTGNLSLVAFDNKGMSTPVTKAVTMAGVMQLSFRRSGGTVFTSSYVPNGLRVFYFPTQGSHVQGALQNERISSSVAISGTHNTGRTNLNNGWSMVSWADDPNVEWNDYNTTGFASGVDLYDVEAALKPHPSHNGYYMPLASAARNMYWQKVSIAKGAPFTNPIEIRHLVASAQIGIQVNRIDYLKDPSSGEAIDPNRLWIALDGQGRACDFYEAEVSKRTRGSLPLACPMALNISSISGTTAYVDYFGSFGSLKPVSADVSRRLGIRLMYDDQQLAGQRYNVDAATIDMASNYYFTITVSPTGTISINISADGWRVVWASVDL